MRNKYLDGCYSIVQDFLLLARLTSRRIARAARSPTHSIVVVELKLRCGYNHDKE